MFTEEEKEQLLTDIKDIKHILTGNGDPERGLVYKVKRHEDIFGWVNKFLWIVVTTALGLPFTVWAGITIIRATTKG